MYVLKVYILYCEFYNRWYYLQVPQLVDQYLAGDLPIDHYITHTFKGVENINEAMELLHAGSCLRAVIEY